METVVAITLLAAIFVMLAGLFSAMLINTVFARQNQQAIDVISEHIERIRGGAYEDAALRPTDFGGDCKIVTVPAPPRFDPDCGGPIPATEPVVLSVTGTVYPHQSVVVRNNVLFTVTRYVTTATDSVVAGADYRRVVVHATWRENGRRRDREASTLITLSRRGLPLPKFTYSTAVTKTVNQGDVLVLPGRVVNSGARDRFDLTAVATGRSWSFKWYVDVDGNGQKDVEDTTELTDTDLNGTVDTGLLETDTEKRFVAVYTVPATEPVTTALSPVTVTRTARSAAQPTASTGTATLTDKVNVVSDLCTGCTPLTFYLRSGGSPGADTATTLVMPVDATSSTFTGALPNYDVGRDTDPGRTVASATLLGCGTGCPPGSTDTDAGRVASWRFDAPNAMTLKGDLALNLWLVMRNSDPNLNLRLTVYVRSETSPNNFVVQGSQVLTRLPSGFSVFSPVQVRVPVDFSIGKNRRLEVRVLVDSGSDAWLAYDTSAYPSNFVLPVVSGA
ncbi:MAG TPA: hypothetical protein VMZ51_00525 [Acidimicrobiales bacterium]|nr:hypothetical protein [Acidimicrobiales bacterium]